MTIAEKTLNDLLTAHGHSTTKPRTAVLLALLKSSEPLSVSQLVAQLKDRADRASIYRTIDLFEKLGVIQRVYQGWKYKLELSDQFSEHHHHLTCTNCARTVNISEPEPLTRLIDQLGRDHGYRIAAHQLELQGLCPACQITEVPLFNK